MTKRATKTKAVKAWKDPFPPYDPPTDKPHLIPVVFGDWSDDGHSGTERAYVWSNKNLTAWRTAFVQGCATVGVNLSEDVAHGYEDTTIAAEDLAALRASGFDRALENEPDTEGTADITLEEFEAMFFHVVLKGDPEITYTELEHGAHHMEMHPGGYGLLGDG